MFYAATGAPDSPVAGRTAEVVLAPATAMDDAQRVRFAAVKEAVGVEHPALAPILAAGEADGWVFVGRAPVPAPTLAARLARDGAMAPPAVVRLVDAVAQGLDALHARGLAHGAVTPEHVGGPDGAGAMLDGVAPIGAARAPEGGAPSPASDQYNLAMLAAAALTGRSPVPDQGRLDLGLPAPLTEAVARGMSGAPADRFPDVLAFAAAVRDGAAASADAMFGAVWEALARRDFGMATMLLDGATRLTPDHRELPALLARLRAEGHAPDAAVGALPTEGLGSAENAGAAGGLLSVPIPTGFEFLAPPPAPPQRGGNPWVLFAIVGFLGLIALVVLTLLVLVYQA